MTEKTQEQNSETAKVQISIRWKILIGFTLIFTIVYFLAMAMFTNLAVTAAEDQIQEDLTQALEGAVSGIDLQTVLELAETGEPNADGFSDDPRFIELLDWLDDVHTAEPDAWPYIYIKSDVEGEIIFVVDLLARYDTSSAGGFMEPYKSNSGALLTGLNEQTYRAVDREFIQKLKGWAGNMEEKRPGLSNSITNFANWLVDGIGLFPKKDFGVYDDKSFGTWASGYMPLKNGEGIAALGVDFTSKMVRQVQENVRSSVRRAFLISYPVLLIIVFWFSSVFTRPLITLTAAAERVGEGDYDVEFKQLISERNRDEIDVLASVFSVMVQKVYKREQNLRQQVARLRIEIDQTKKQEEVGQIVDSDFFKHLQSRASRLRSRRGAGEIGEIGEDDNQEEEENQAEE